MLRVEIVTTFGWKIVTISARNTIIGKLCYVSKAIFFVLYNISPINFGILLLLIGSFREFRGFCPDFRSQKLVHINAKLSIACINFRDSNKVHSVSLS